MNSDRIREVLEALRRKTRIEPSTVMYALADLDEVEKLVAEYDAKKSEPTIVSPALELQSPQIVLVEPETPPTPAIESFSLDALFEEISKRHPLGAVMVVLKETPEGHDCDVIYQGSPFTARGLVATAAQKFHEMFAAPIVLVPTPVDPPEPSPTGPDYNPIELPTLL